MMCPRSRAVLFVCVLGGALALCECKRPSDLKPKPLIASAEKHSLLGAPVERAAVPARYRWNPAHLYPNEKAWHQDRRQLHLTLDEIVEGCRRELKAGAKQVKGVKSCLDRLFSARKRLGRLLSYAKRRHDEDTRRSKFHRLLALAHRDAARFRLRTAFLEPELLALPRGRLADLLTDSELVDYRQLLRSVVRREGHARPAEEEALLTGARRIAEDGRDLYATLTGDFSFPSIRDREDRPIELDRRIFQLFRTRPNQRIRREAFDAYLAPYRQHRHTLAALLQRQVAANQVLARAGSYGSALEAALHPNDVPPALVHRLIKEVNKQLPLLNRYLRLKEQLMGAPPQYFDLNALPPSRGKLGFPYKRGRKVLGEALAPLGASYNTALSAGLEPKNGWLDLLPNAGKRSGAYMDASAYDVHPYVLCNYREDYASLISLAHVMGHAVHAHLANRHQPYPMAELPVLVTETAAILNEVLLHDYLLRSSREPRVQLAVLVRHLELYRRLLYRQVLFTEFELEIYRLSKEGEPLGPDLLSRSYLKLVRKYHKHPVTVHERFGVEWATVPQLYLGFYCYRYALGTVAAMAFAEQLSERGASASERYVRQVLQAGGSDLPLAILKRGGVDLNDGAVFEVAFLKFKERLQRAEDLVDKMGLAK